MYTTKYFIVPEYRCMDLWYIDGNIGVEHKLVLKLLKHFNKAFDKAFIKTISKFDGEIAVETLFVFKKSFGIYFLAMEKFIDKIGWKFFDCI